MKEITIDRRGLTRAVRDIPTPFYLYDEKAIRNNAREFIASFSGLPHFTEFFAVKANPNPWLLQVLREEGLGADCSSLPELLLARAAGIEGGKIVFTSNNTPLEEYRQAIAAGALLNLDDVTHIDYLLDNEVSLPEFISFRYNPGNAREGGNAIIGKPGDAKYGCTRSQIMDVLPRCRKLGVKRFGLHTMIASNEMDLRWFTETARMMFELALDVLEQTGIAVELVNLGGGVGIPYRPGQKSVDLKALGASVQGEYDRIIRTSVLHPLKVAMECGRVILGPYGWLVTKAVHRKDIYKNYIGVDACMAALMRPGLYGAYHHISVLGKEDQTACCKYDIVGSLCENNDKFAIDREMPRIENGDFLVIHDAGAHGHSMGFNYNGKLRPAEYLLCENGDIKLVRRAETIREYFATLDYPGL